MHIYIEGLRTAYALLGVGLVSIAKKGIWLFKVSNQVTDDFDKGISASTWF